MSSSLIPWHAFFKAMQEHQSRDLHRWLEHWRFTDEGAVLLDTRRDLEALPISLNAKQKQAARFLIRKGIWPRPFAER